jgi:6-pyruvoyltetrahydropterin/6-carboxytetrahydropterin synthase
VWYFLPIRPPAGAKYPFAPYLKYQNFAAMLLYKEFTFDSAHFLPNVPDGHKCKEMHGHTYRLRVWLQGKPDPQLGWIIDFAVLKSIVKPVVAELDHKCMNNVPGLENPTCELIAVWIWDRLKPMLPAMARIELHETPTSGVIYEGH